MAPNSSVLGRKRIPIDVYKKISVMRKHTDCVLYEDSDGKLQRICDLGQEALSATPSLKTKVKLDIPIPTIQVSESYLLEVPATFAIPNAYIRFCKPTLQEAANTIDYTADEEDELWLLKYPNIETFTSLDKPCNMDASNSEDMAKAGTASKSKKKMSSKSYNKKDTNSLKTFVMSVQGSDGAKSSLGNSLTDIDDGNFNARFQHRINVPMYLFETIIDTFEKATAFETIIAPSQAEQLVYGKNLNLQQIISCDKSPALPELSGEQKGRMVISDIYNYWVQKRCKVKKPLLRKFWPVTASNDTNPYLVFRPREKGKYRLRKKRQNDIETFVKMKQLRHDFEKLKALLDLVRVREKLNSALFDLRSDWFEQQIYNMVDTSDLPRDSGRLCRAKIETLLKIPQYIDLNSAERGKKKKRKKSGSSRVNDLVQVSVPLTNSDSEQKHESSSGPSAPLTPLRRNVASQENPPLFCQPLASRESYASSWDYAVPFVSSYVDANPTPTFRFRHRPRLGRGGRIIIDRYPRPGNPDLSPFQAFRTGDTLLGPVCAQQLLDLLPAPLDHVTLSRRIEAISATALDETIDEINTANSNGNTMMRSGQHFFSESSKNEQHEILVSMDDWLSTDEILSGDERFSLGQV